MKSLQFAVDAWTEFNRCAAKPTMGSTSALVHSIYKSCAGGTSVELYKIIDGPHAWPMGVKLGPGAELPSNALDASKVIWEFFERHPKRPP